MKTINQVPQQNINQVPQQNINQVPQQNINQVPQQNINQQSKPAACVSNSKSNIVHLDDFEDDDDSWLTSRPLPQLPKKDSPVKLNRSSPVKFNKLTSKQKKVCQTVC